MSSKCSVRVVSILPSLHLLPLFLCLIYGVQGATLREHRLSEPGSYEPGSQLRPPPSDEMLRALRYIQSLSQRTSSEPSADDHQLATTDLQPDDMESVRSMLHLAAPARGSTGMERDLEEREDEHDKWLQAVLTTLQQTEEQTVPQKTPKKMSWKTSSPSRQPIKSLPRPQQQQEETSSAENYERTSWANAGSRRRHRQYPLMYEDEDDQDQPLKRTNENAEEQYTPQKLATLQSVFEELSGISTSKTNNRRESAAATTDDDDDDNLYRQRKMALDDIMGTDEWEPLEEQTETEEEQRQRHEFNSNFDDDYFDIFKRSDQPDWFQTDNLEDIAKLVDLLKVLESKQQKREKENDREQEKKDTDEEEEEDDEEEDEEKDKEERDIKSVHGTFPQSLSELIKISQKLNIPPADVLDLLQNDPRNFRIPPHNPAQSRTAPLTYTTYAAAPHQRPLLTSQSNSAAQDILSILELVSAVQLNDKLPQRPLQTKPSHYYLRERDVPEYGFPETIRDDYDDTAGDEDELASFLASEMLTQGQRLNGQRSTYDKLQRVIQDYLDKNEPKKRPVEHKSIATSFDDDRMMRILRYLEPENDDADDTDSEEKTVPEM